MLHQNSIILMLRRQQPYLLMLFKYGVYKKSHLIIVLFVEFYIKVMVGIDPCKFDT